MYREEDNDQDEESITCSSVYGNIAGFGTEMRQLQLTE